MHCINKSMLNNPHLEFDNSHPNILIGQVINDRSGSTLIAFVPLPPSTKVNHIN